MAYIRLLGLELGLGLELELGLGLGLRLELGLGLGLGLGLELGLGLGLGLGHPFVCCSRATILKTGEWEHWLLLVGALAPHWLRVGWPLIG